MGGILTTRKRPKHTIVTVLRSYQLATVLKVLGMKELGVAGNGGGFVPSTAQMV